jgi:hypothetical protein
MNTATLTSDRILTRPGANRRSITDLTAPVDRLTLDSASLLAKPLATFDIAGETYRIPRYLFIGPRGGDDPIRLGIFAGIHGNEPEGSLAAIQLLQLLEMEPEIARDYCLFVYPVCNPTGYEDNTRFSRQKRDLNREFWSDSQQPEVRLLETELYTHAFDGIVSLHSDDASHGLYGFVRGATLTRHLLEPALEAAHEILPRNGDRVIDGFKARNGIIEQSYRGTLRAPPKITPKPFEIVLETPQVAPVYRQARALVVAVLSIMAEYRKLAAYAPNL